MPIKPGGEGAMALAMIRWILDHERYDARYLTNANRAAAKADGEPTWCNATWLVKIDKGEPGGFLRASDLKLPTEKRVHKDKKTAEETPYEFDPATLETKARLAYRDRIGGRMGGFSHPHFDPRDGSTAHARCPSRRPTAPTTPSASRGRRRTTCSAQATSSGCSRPVPASPTSG